MKPGSDLHKKLSKKYQPSTMVDMRFKEKDISFKTDDEGNPVVLFIGTRTADGTIRGERYVRTLITGKDGKVTRDHWDLKGKAS